MRLIMEQRTKYRFDFKSWDQSLLLVWFFKLGLLLIIEIQGSLNLEISQELWHQCFIQKPRLALHVTTTYSCLCNFQSVNTRPFPINMSKIQTLQTLVFKRTNAFAHFLISQASRHVFAGVYSRIPMRETHWGCPISAFCMLDQSLILE